MISWTNLLTTTESSNRPFFSSTYPKVVVWNVTSRCNLLCRHCYFSATSDKNENELNFKEAGDFISDLTRFKVPTILFSGGEPLLREDIFQLAKLAKAQGIKAGLSTNGTLIDSKVAQKIKSAGFYYVGISLDGAQETNDNFRQSKGAFQASWEGIRNCQKIGLRVGIRFTLTKYNLLDLPSMFDLVEKESIPRFCIYHLVYSGRASNFKNDDLNGIEKRAALEFIWKKCLEFQQKGLNLEVLTVDNHTDGAWIYLKLKKLNPKLAVIALQKLKEQGGNSSGVKIGAVDNCGSIYPDQFWRTRSLGNIRQNRFSEVWQNSDDTFLRALRNRKVLLKGRCQRCSFLSICNGNLRCRAETVSGDVWAEDPACYLTEAEINTTFN